MRSQPEDGCGLGGWADRPTEQALEEALLARECGYHLGLLSLGAMKGANEDELIRHCKRIAEVLPLFGFYLQPAAGGIDLSYAFWRRFAEIENLRAIKIAAFDRYKTLDVIRAVADADRSDIALYTGNDDNIVVDLVSNYRWPPHSLRFVGGLLGHWAVWTHKAVELHQRCQQAFVDPSLLPELLELSIHVTDSNAAIFDPQHQFRGCIPGILEILRRQGLVETNLCLHPQETLSQGQAQQLDRVCTAYPHLIDDEFVQIHLADWRRN